MPSKIDVGESMVARLRGAGDAIQANTGYPACVLTHDIPRRLRRAFLALSVACSLVLGAALFSPATADEPTTWETVPDVSAFDFVMLVLVIPLGLALVITLLTLVPLLINDRGYQPGQSWRSQVEWFGGPSKGVRAADEVTAEQVEARSKDTGGTSGSW